MEAMQLPYLTIAEAVEKTNRSPSTIRRIIRSIADKKSHPDRIQISPSVQEVDQFKKKGENFTWKICEEVLLKNLHRVQEAEKKQARPFSSNVEGEILGILQEELKIKNRQIEKQGEIIQSLNERLREGNILMATLHKQLTLPSPEPVQSSPSMKASTESSMKPSRILKKPARRSPPKADEGGASKVASKPPSKQPSKRGFLAWLSGS